MVLAYFLLGCLAYILSYSLYFESAAQRLFVIIFSFRYYRLLVGIVAYFLHTAVAPPKSPSLTSNDVTVIIPTVNPNGLEFLNTITSILKAGCYHIIVVVPAMLSENLPDLGEKVTFKVCPVANKRRQVSIGLQLVRTRIVFLADDHVHWPSGFIPAVLAPFENPKVGGVAMWKRVLRCKQSFFNLADFWNFIGCLYLERHNFDLTASHAIDGGLFVISGRTAAYRSSIICTEEFIEAFCNEKWLGVGPLNADDDNFLTRWLVSRGWKLGWQHGAACMETYLGDTGFKKFNSQCLRWVRTTWRSNSTSLCDGAVWKNYPWSVYAIYWTSFFNFALFTDFSLFYLCRASGWSSLGLVFWILTTKMVKPLPYFLRHPWDLIYFPGYLLFGYYHSILKLYALFTTTNTTWGSRPGLVK
jgi:hypothetical protein